MIEYRYQAYGLTLSANHPIDNLTPAPGAAAADLLLRLGGEEIGAEVPVPASAWVARQDRFPLWTAPTPEGTYFRLRYAGVESCVDFIFDPTG